MEYLVKGKWILTTLFLSRDWKGKEKRKEQAQRRNSGIRDLPSAETIERWYNVVNRGITHTQDTKIVTILCLWKNWFCLQNHRLAFTPLIRDATFHYSVTNQTEYCLLIIILFLIAYYTIAYYCLLLIILLWLLFTRFSSLQTNSTMVYNYAKPNYYYPWNFWLIVGSMLFFVKLLIFMSTVKEFSGYVDLGIPFATWYFNNSEKILIVNFSFEIKRKTSVIIFQNYGGKRPTLNKCGIHSIKKQLEWRLTAKRKNT